MSVLVQKFRNVFMYLLFVMHPLKMAKLVAETCSRRTMCNILLYTDVYLFVLRSYLKGTAFRKFIPHDLVRTEAVCYRKMTLLCAQAQLGSIVTVPWGPVNIRSLKELMESDLNLKAHWKIVGSLLNSSDDPVIREVIARLQPVGKVTELVDELQTQRNPNFAYLMYRRSMQFYASQSVSSLVSSVLKQISVQGVRKFPPKRFLQEIP